jgi:hypothetical protein
MSGNGTSLVLPVYDFDLGASFDLHPATGLIFGDSGGSVLVSTSAGLPSINTRRDGFIAANAGRRFTTTNVFGTPVTGQIGFTDTTPTFLLRQSASTKRVVLRTINLGLAAGAGGSFRVAIVIDTADRFSAGGTSLTPENTNTGSATPSAVTAFLLNPTATAAGVGTRPISHVAASASNGTNITFNFGDGVLIGTTGSLLVYATSMIASAPSLFFTFEWEEID